MKNTLKLTITFMLLLALAVLPAVASPVSASYTSFEAKAYSTDDIPPPQIGDVNGDGEVDSLDAALVLKLDAGIIDYLPVNAPIEPLDPELEDQIRLDYWTNYLGNKVGGTSVWDTTIDNVVITGYFGCFSGCEIVYFEDNYPEESAYQAIWVGNHGFAYGSSKEAFAYKDGEFYTFPEAFNAGYLTPDDIYALGTRMQIAWNGVAASLNPMGDYNFDMSIDSLDAAGILRYDAGLE